MRVSYLTPSTSIQKLFPFITSEMVPRDRIAAGSVLCNVQPLLVAPFSLEKIGKKGKSVYDDHHILEARESRHKLNLAEN